VRDEIIRAFENLPTAEGFSIIYLDELKPSDRRVLLERNLVSQEYSLASGKAIAVRDEGRMSGVLNDRDHLRLSAVLGGLGLQEAYGRVDEVDSALEEYLHYAASLEWGYLTGSVHDAGTGLRASVMLHLPALAMTNLIEKTLKTAAGIGLRVKGFFGEGSGSLGDMYQVSNEVAIGMGESEILSVLEEDLEFRAKGAGGTGSEKAGGDRGPGGASLWCAHPLSLPLGKGSDRPPFARATRSESRDPTGTRSRCGHPAAVPLSEVAYSEGYGYNGERSGHQTHRLHASTHHT
jgi:hypothetical protein